jgi:hypothetical protein
LNLRSQALKQTLSTFQLSVAVQDQALGVFLSLNTQSHNSTMAVNLLNGAVATTLLHKSTAYNMLSQAITTIGMPDES